MYMPNHIESAIIASHLRRSFSASRNPLRKREDIIAVHDVSFSVLAGTIFGLLGPNGAGKTATIKMLTTLLIGRYAFGVHFDSNIPAVVLALVLFLLSLSGMGLVFSGFGLLLKKANPQANLVWNGLTLQSGAWFPESHIPDWLRYLARALPLGYGFEALSASMLRHASIAAISTKLLPLAGFAIGLPLFRVCAFASLERLVRERGELDLY